MDKRYTVKDAVRFETRGVLAGAYRGRGLEKALLTHRVAIVVNENGHEVEGLVLCRGVKLESIVDMYSDSTEALQARPTCPRCAAKFDLYRCKEECGKSTGVQSDTCNDKMGGK